MHTLNQFFVQSFTSFLFPLSLTDMSSSSNPKGNGSNGTPMAIPAQKMSKAVDLFIDQVNGLDPLDPATNDGDQNDLNRVMTDADKLMDELRSVIKLKQSTDSTANKTVTQTKNNKLRSKCFCMDLWVKAFVVGTVISVAANFITFVVLSRLPKLLRFVPEQEQDKEFSFGLLISVLKTMYLETAFLILSAIFVQSVAETILRFKWIRNSSLLFRDE